MQKVIASAEMREIDRLTTERYGTPSLLLMEAAAASAAEAIKLHFSGDLARKKVCILCGRGNNGGDGAALARTLWRAGAHVDVILFGRIEDSQADAHTNFEMARRLSSFEAGSRALPSLLTFVECETIEAWEETASAHRHYDLLVDALLGTGLTRPLAGIHLKVVAHLALQRQARERARANAPCIVSLDIPSGLNADSAEPIGEAVRADLTVTFAAPKPANVLPPASEFGGALVVANIGSPPALIEQAASKLFLVEAADAREWLVKTRYASGSYKNIHGHALVIAGSRNLTGAAVLSSNAAMRAGAGLITIATARSALETVAARTMPEVMTAALAETEDGAIGFQALVELDALLSKAAVIAIGPGLTSSNEETRRFVRAIIEQRRTPVVIDADGLNSLAPWPESLRGSREHPLILTPHIGEMRRLLGADENDQLRDRVALAREFAVAHEIILVLKGTRTLAASPDGRVHINPTGNAGLGTAGAGDTLTGVITGFLAQEFGAMKTEADALQATIAALYTSGLAGDIAARRTGMRTLTASDIRESLSEAILELDAQGEMP